MDRYCRLHIHATAGVLPVAMVTSVHQPAMNALHRLVRTLEVQDSPLIIHAPAVVLFVNQARSAQQPPTSVRLPVTGCRRLYPAQGLPQTR